MGEKSTTYETFPAWISILATFVTLSIYAVGAYILSGFGTLLVGLYLIYCLWIEIGVLKRSCVDCYYYGKNCGLGRGKLCALLFPKGHPQRFVDREISWVQILPDLMVFLIPLAGGIILLIGDFSWSLAAMVVFLVLLATAGNAAVRGSLACKYCKQREIGCPAEKLFARER